MLPGKCGINKTFSNNILSKKYAEGLKLNGLKFVWGIVVCCYPKEWSRNNIDTFWCAITYKAHCTVYEIWKVLQEQQEKPKKNIFQTY